jgi:hypothetical protein
MDLNEVENPESGPPSLTLIDQVIIPRFLTLCSQHKEDWTCYSINF